MSLKNCFKIAWSGKNLFSLRSFFLLFAAFFLFQSQAWASPGQEYEDARAAFYSLQKSSSKQQYRHHWDRVLDGLQHFIQKHPDHAHAADACYLLARAYERLSEISRSRADLDSAIRTYCDLAQRYPSDSLADDGLLRAADLLYHRQSDSDQARVLCERLVERYPRGDMRGKANSLLDQVGRSDSSAGPSAVSAPAPLSRDVELVGVRSQVEPEHTRIVLELTGVISPEPHLLHHPERLFFDLPGVRKQAALFGQYPVDGKSVVKQVRIGESTQALRVVCDLEHETRYQVFTLESPPRIVIDLTNQPTAGFSVDTPQLRNAPKVGGDQIARLIDQKPAAAPLRVRLPDALSEKKHPLRIVVDAGHGGKDPGALGPGSLQEKDVTLAIAKKLAAQLRADLDCEVLLTREKDVYLELRERTAYANEVNADLFLSIHANASPNKKTSGTETFFLNFSKNDQAVEVAARENGMSLKEVSNLEIILFDLMANAKINESSRLAAEIQKSLVGKLGKTYGDVRDLGVKQGPFHVLLGATMPSVLIEVGFISNKNEARRLNNRDYQTHAATGIVQGVKSYLKTQNLLAKAR